MLHVAWSHFQLPRLLYLFSRPFHRLTLCLNIQYISLQNKKNQLSGLRSICAAACETVLLAMRLLLNCTGLTIRSGETSC